jgi:hypothetical protein
VTRQHKRRTVWQRVRDAACKKRPLRLNASETIELSSVIYPLANLSDIATKKWRQENRRTWFQERRQAKPSIGPVWPQLSTKVAKVCDLLCKGMHREKIAVALKLPRTTVSSRLAEAYRIAGIAHDKQKEVALAVLLTYERHPELRPRDGLRCETNHGVTADETINYTHPYPNRPTGSNRIAGPVFYWTKAPGDLQGRSAEPARERGGDACIPSEVFDGRMSMDGSSKMSDKLETAT